jgi:hypothetical protein
VQATGGVTAMACIGTTPFCLTDHCVACDPNVAAHCSDNAVVGCSATGGITSMACIGTTPFCLTDHCVACDPAAFRHPVLERRPYPPDLQPGRCRDQHDMP